MWDRGLTGTSSGGDVDSWEMVYKNSLHLLLNPAVTLKPL